MIRALVVDDEPVARRGLVKLLGAEPDVEVVGQAADGDEAIGLIRRERPDVLFLDIQMPERDGLAVARAVRELDPAPVVVFVTAHADYAVRAFEVDAVDYLLKPFDRERFRQTVDRAFRELRRAALDDADAASEALGRLSGFDRRPRARDRLVLKVSGRIVVLEPGEVEWVEAAGNYVRIRTDDDEHLVRETLSDLEALLAPHGFKRISRSVIVNLNTVREVRPGTSGTRIIVLRDGRRFGVSRRSWPAVLSGLERLRRS